MVSYNILFKAVDEPMNIVKVRFGTKTFKVLEEVIWQLIPRVDPSFTDVYEYDLMIDNLKPNNEDMIIDCIKDMFAYETPDIDIPKNMSMLDRFILMKFVDMNFAESKCSSFGSSSKRSYYDVTVNFYPPKHDINEFPEKDITYGDMVNMIIDCNHRSFQYIDKKMIRDGYMSLMEKTGLLDLYTLDDSHKCNDEENDEEDPEIIMTVPDKNKKIVVPMICGPDCNAHRSVYKFHKMLSSVAKKMGLKKGPTILGYPEICYYMEQMGVTCVDHMSKYFTGL